MHHKSEIVVLSILIGFWVILIHQHSKTLQHEYSLVIVFSFSWVCQLWAHPLNLKLLEEQMTNGGTFLPVPPHPLSTISISHSLYYINLTFSHHHSQIYQVSIMLGEYWHLSEHKGFPLVAIWSIGLWLGDCSAAMWFVLLTFRLPVWDCPVLVLPLDCPYEITQCWYYLPWQLVHTKTQHRKLLA